MNLLLLLALWALSTLIVAGYVGVFAAIAINVARWFL